MGGSDHIALTQTLYMPAGERRARCAPSKIGLAFRGPVKSLTCWVREVTILANSNHYQ